jgi:hypothetical protein
MSRTDAGTALIGSPNLTQYARSVEIVERKNQVVTPQAIENRLATLSREIDEAHAFLEQAEHAYHKAKTQYEIAIATARLSYGTEKMRVQDVNDHALLECRDQYRALNEAEAVVKAARANATRIRTQVDIARSIGTSVRASLEI